jgi:transposase
MLALNNQQRYFLFQDVVDMRKGIDGLSGLVRDHLKLNPLSGDVYLFFNRKRNQVKLLMWDKDGFALYYKRLEKGTYELPKSADAAIGVDVLLCILQGIRLTAMRKRKRYEHAA